MSKDIGVGAEEVAELREGKRCVIWHDERLKIGEVMWVRKLFTKGPGYEAKVVKVLGTRKTRSGDTCGETITDYLVEPTGRVKEKVAYC